MAREKKNIFADKINLDAFNIFSKIENRLNLCFKASHGLFSESLKNYSNNNNNKKKT